MHDRNRISITKYAINQWNDSLGLLFKFTYSGKAIFVGETASEIGTYTIAEDVRSIKVEAAVGFRTIFFYNKDGKEITSFGFYTNMFADKLTETLKIKEGEELIGFAVVLGDQG